MLTEPDPAAAITKLNALIYQSGIAEQFVTLMAAVLDPARHTVTLVNAGHVRVISMEEQPKLVEEIKRQYAGAFDPAQVAKWGKQVGARYIVTGKVYSTDERQDGERRVQYFLFIQVLDVETGEVLFQRKTSVTKALI
jgi:PBP1b-binding outer membrane lipoprotein LpoB